MYFNVHFEPEDTLAVKTFTCWRIQADVVLAMHSLCNKITFGEVPQSVSEFDCPFVAG